MAYLNYIANKKPKEEQLISAIFLHFLLNYFLEFCFQLKEREKKNLLNTLNAYIILSCIADS